MINLDPSGWCLFPEGTLFKVDVVFLSAMRDDECSDLIMLHSLFSFLITLYPCVKFLARGLSVDQIAHNILIPQTLFAFSFLF